MARYKFVIASNDTPYLGAYVIHTDEAPTLIAERFAIDKGWYDPESGDAKEDCYSVCYLSSADEITDLGVWPSTEASNE